MTWLILTYFSIRLCPHSRVSQLFVPILRNAGLIRYRKAALINFNDHILGYDVNTHTPLVGFL